MWVVSDAPDLRLLSEISLEISSVQVRGYTSCKPFGTILFAHPPGAAFPPLPPLDAATPLPLSLFSRLTALPRGKGRMSGFENNEEKVGAMHALCVQQ